MRICAVGFVCSLAWASVLFGAYQPPFNDGSHHLDTPYRKGWEF